MFVYSPRRGLHSQQWEWCRHRTCHLEAVTAIFVVVRWSRTTQRNMITGFSAHLNSKSIFSSLLLFFLLCFLYLLLFYASHWFCSTFPFSDWWDSEKTKCIPHHTCTHIRIDAPTNTHTHMRAHLCVWECAFVNSGGSWCGLTAWIKVW